MEEERERNFSRRLWRDEGGEREEEATKRSAESSEEKSIRQTHT